MLCAALHPSREALCIRAVPTCLPKSAGTTWQAPNAVRWWPCCTACKFVPDIHRWRMKQCPFAAAPILRQAAWPQPCHCPISDCTACCASSSKKNVKANPGYTLMFTGCTGDCLRICSVHIPLFRGLQASSKK